MVSEAIRGFVTVFQSKCLLFRPCRLPNALLIRPGPRFLHDALVCLARENVVGLSIGFFDSSSVILALLHYCSVMSSNTLLLFGPSSGFLRSFLRYIHTALGATVVFHSYRLTLKIVGFNFADFNFP